MAVDEAVIVLLWNPQSHLDSPFQCRFQFLLLVLFSSLPTLPEAAERRLYRRKWHVSEPTPSPVTPRTGCTPPRTSPPALLRRFGPPCRVDTHRRRRPGSPPSDSTSKPDHKRQSQDLRLVWKNCELCVLYLSWNLEHVRIAAF